MTKKQIVINTIKGLKEPAGIREFFVANYKFNTENVVTVVKKYLKIALMSGALVQTKAIIHQVPLNSEQHLQQEFQQQNRWRRKEEHLQKQKPKKCKNKNWSRYNTLLCGTPGRMSFISDYTLINWNLLSSLQITTQLSARKLSSSWRESKDDMSKRALSW